MKILIVEDEQRAREGLARLIKSLDGDYEIVGQISNGQAALERILQVKPDLVFTDIKMPYMDGMEMIRNVRDYNLKTEFVILSAYGDFELARQSISLEVTEYLLKPVTLEDVEKTLERVKKRLSGGHGFSGRESVALRQKYPEAHPMVLKILDIIESGYAGKINQRDLALELGISPEYFSYIFSKNIGQTFSVFLQNYRVEMAKELFIKGECDRRDVPYKVGFSDAKYFNQVFKKITGKTPGEFISQM